MTTRRRVREPVAHAHRGGPSEEDVMHPELHHNLYQQQEVETVRDAELRRRVAERAEQIARAMAAVGPEAARPPAAVARASTTGTATAVAVVVRWARRLVLARPA